MTVRNPRRKLPLVDSSFSSEQVKQQEQLQRRKEGREAEGGEKYEKKIKGKKEKIGKWKQEDQGKEREEEWMKKEINEEGKARRTEESE